MCWLFFVNLAQAKGNTHLERGNLHQSVKWTSLSDIFLIDY